jgi:peptidoglycan/LPS O-acetylase OafA/YrhL
MPLLCTLIVLILSSEVTLSQRVARIADWLGDLSFPLYLFHIPAFVLMLTLGVKNTWLVLSGPVLIATVALYLIDYPSRRAIPLIFKRRGQKAIDPRDVPLADDLAVPPKVEPRNLAAAD